MLDQYARGVAAGGDAQAFARRVGMGLDGAFADIEGARDFLRLEMLRDQPQDLFLAFGECLDPGRSVPQIQPLNPGIFSNETKENPCFHTGHE